MTAAILAQILALPLPTIAISAAALGMGAAQLTGATACDWRAKPGQMKARLTRLKQHRPMSVARRTAGTVALALVLTGGALLAYAAEPGAPAQLPKDVAGVVGSGDQLSLNLKEEGAAPRMLKVGETYKEGWVLQALTPSSAALAKAGEVREVGLNPTGALAQAAPAAPATEVRLTGDLDAAAIERLNQTYAARIGADKVAATQDTLLKFGAAYLSLDQYRRRTAYLEMRSQAGTDAAFRAQVGETAYADYRDLTDRFMAALNASAGITQPTIMILRPLGSDPAMPLPDLPAALRTNPYMAPPVMVDARQSEPPSPRLPEATAP